MSQTVARAIEILERISAQPGTPSQIAAALGVHRSTALRLLESLADGGLVRCDADGRYRIGYRLAGLAHQAREQLDLVNVATPSLQRLCDATGQTVHLAALERGTIVYAAKLEPARSVRLYSQVGHAVTLHTAAVSKALLAHQPSDRVEALLAGHHFERFTEHTITSAAAFRAELAAVRERGWAIDDGEFEHFVHCIAVPVLDFRGEATAAVSITALQARTGFDELLSLLPQLGDTADEVSTMLGWRPLSSA